MALHGTRVVQQLPSTAARAMAQSRPSTIGLITLGTKETGKPSARNSHAGFDAAGTGNRLADRLVRHSQRKRGATDRSVLRGTAPVLDPTLGGGAGNEPRTSIPRQSFTRQNRIKEQFSLFAGRVSAETLCANQLRLYFSALAYVLVHGLRRLGLSETELARAQAGTIRLKLLKIGAQIRISARKVWVSIASSYPYQFLFQQAYQQLRS